MVSRFFAGSSKFRPRRKEGVCRGKESNIIQKRRKLFPRCESFPILHLRGEGMVRGEREMLVAVVKNFISAITFPIIIRWQMDSLCVSRGRRTSSSGRGLVRLRLPTSRSLESRARRGRGLRAQYRADDKPSSGKSIFDRNAPCFPTTCTRSLRGQGFRTSSGGGGEGGGSGGNTPTIALIFFSLPFFSFLSFFLPSFLFFFDSSIRFRGYKGER